MKKLIFIAAAIFLLPFIGIKGSPAGNPGASQSPSRTDNAPVKSAGQSGYISPTPGKFPIIAYSPVTDERIPTKADFDTLKACGFNCAMTLFNHDEYFDLMGEIKGLGISFIPILDNYTNRRDSIGLRRFIESTRQFMQDNDIPDSLIGGYRIKDEPWYSVIKSAVLPCYNAAKSEDPQALPIVNLPAQPIGNFRPMKISHSYSSDPHKRDTMSLYLNHFCDIVHPDVLSYDYYPFIYRSYTGAIEVNDSDFYYNLQLFARLSKQKDIPFWAFCQSTNIRNCKIDDPNYTEHPEATENFLRYEAFSALAFGAKGINYWRYSDRRDDYSHVTKDSTYSLYLSALTDTLGNCEPAWKCAQAVNLEIKRHEQMFLNAELMSYSFLDSNLNKNLYVRPTDGADIPEYDGAIHISKITGKGVLASRLFDGIDNLILVNLDPFNTTTVKVGYSTDKVRRIFMKCDVICHAIPGGGGIIGPIVNPTDPDDPSISINYPKYKSEEFKLKPGGYAILHYATSSSANENGDETDNK